MWSLFSTSPEESGFRLDYMEIYNWGTFDQKVFRVSPQTNNSLLTGANGSGKTTFVDALLTLLVPLKKDRFYNQSSGVEKKGDRTEESYVLGYYGDIQKEGSSETVAQKLRDEQAYSVILASFKNEEGAQVTLFQCRWFAQRSLKRVFGISHKPLSIEKDFQPFDALGNWKKRLEKIYNTPTKRNIELFNDSPSKYADRMILLFGMRSAKALNLFNQTVGIKVLGDLDEFIRVNMLEPQDTEKEWLLLKESFNTLLQTKTNIAKSKEQIEQLLPIREDGLKYQSLIEQSEQLSTDKKAAQIFFLQKGLELFKQSEKIELKNLRGLTDKIVNLDQKLNELHEHASDLAVQIKNNDVGRELKELERKIAEQQQELNTRKRNYEHYAELLQIIGYEPQLDIKFFENCLKEASNQKASFEQLMESKNRALYQLEKEKTITLEERNKEEYEYEYLLKHPTKIPNFVRRIREQICSDLKIKKNSLPFVGELIQVKSNDKVWEYAIEKVLRSFALSIVVPAKMYTKVNEYVNQTDLKGKLVYYKVDDTAPIEGLRNRSPEQIAGKLNYLETHPLAQWVEHRIATHFNYQCVDNPKALEKYDKAITQEGLLKSGGQRHEKDDRIKGRKQDFILGWDTIEKRNKLKKNLIAYDKSLEKTSQALIQTRTELNTLNQRMSASKELMDYFADFQTINFELPQEEMNKLTQRHALLQSDDNQIQILQAEFNQVKITAQSLQTEQEGLKKAHWKKEAYIENIQKMLAELKEEKAALKENIDLADFDAGDFEHRYPDWNSFTVEEFQQKRTNFIRSKEQELAELYKSGASLREALQKRMIKFKNPSEQLTKRFKDWRSEVFHLPDEVEHVESYIHLLEGLEQDNLPKYEQKFDHYLTDTLLGRVGEFKHFFDNWKSKIEENIQALNAALVNIDYKNVPRTYIQLVAQKSTYHNQRTFRTFLEKAMPNAIDFDSSLEEKKSHFDNNIIPLIDQLDADEKWRKEVMDVRTWYKFFAEEFYQDSGEKMKSYENMGKLSGGEKAQLTYTILGSAISYQFGLTTDGMQTKSFRFIAIDESFSNQDDEKARYLMNLCKQLKLQLLVVTPSDKINVVQDYISYVHFVERRDNKNSWLYDMPIMQFLDEQQAHSS